MSNIIGYCALLYISTSYVAVLYVSSKEAANYKIKRDDPRVIKSRIKKLSMVMLINIILVPYIQYSLGSNYVSTYSEAILNLGIVPGRQLTTGRDLLLYINNIFSLMILIAQLFIGPLTDSLLYYVFTKGRTLYTDFNELFDNIWGMRNYVFAPITEELFYTSMLLTTYIAFFPTNELNYKRLLLEPSLFFGLAHAHHAYESYQTGQYGMVSIFFNTMFQVIYTSLFGALTKYAFLMTGGNLWACILLHSFCNVMGFPTGSNFEFHFTIVEKTQNKTFMKFVQVWKKFYMGLLVVGVVLFIKHIETIGLNTTSINFS